MTESSAPDSWHVEPDHYQVTEADQLLCARLDGTFVICFYDAVQEAGALVHLRIGPRGRPLDANLTDTTLSSDLLLIDRALEQLKQVAPRAQHWQARLLAQVSADAGAQQRFAGIRELLEGFLLDSGVKLVSCELLNGAQPDVRFRPAMGKAYAG